MDLFKFDPLQVGVSLAGGRLVDGWDSLTWTERYLDNGEFVLETSIDLRGDLPLGTLVSHTNTKEVMVVENYSISDERGQPTKFVISGRTFDTFLENRVIGSNLLLINTGEVKVDGQVDVQPNPTWIQVRNIINTYIQLSNLQDDDDALHSIDVEYNVTGDSVPEERFLNRASVYSEVKSILSIDKLGLRSIRPSNENLNLVFEIYNGVDRSDKVAFSYNDGDVESADYLWTIKKLKNSALVVSRYYVIAVKGPEAGYDRRWMVVDASDLDDSYDTKPTGATQSTIYNRMKARGREALSKQNMLAITNAKISPTATKYRYRVDYGLGDIVGVEGNYSASSKMRVIEHVEIHDKNGQSAYPTLDEIEEE